jgi:hypothetical protein
MGSVLAAVLQRDGEQADQASVKAAAERHVWPHKPVAESPAIVVYVGASFFLLKGVSWLILICRFIVPPHPAPAVAEQLQKSFASMLAGQ